MNCYVLTGGMSRRMGTSKALLELQGRRFIERVVDAAKLVFPEVIAVTRAGEPTYDDLETIHEDPHPEASAIYGVRRALQHSGDRAWVLAIDYPLITPGLLRYLRERFERSSAELLVPDWHGQPQLLCAGYSSSLSGMLDAMILAGRLRIRELMAAADTERVGEDEIRAAFAGEPLWNVNLPEDYERLRREHER